MEAAREDGLDTGESASDLLRSAVIRAVSGAGAAAGDRVRARDLHAGAVNEMRAAAQPALARWESRLLTRSFAAGRTVDAARVCVRIRLVDTPADKRLFRYAALHWSIPISNGYGRRLRFLVEDASNDKLIGIIGLGDPVFALKDRDSWIGWLPEVRAKRLRCVMDAFVLGAVPPYSMLRGGKVVAAVATSLEVQEAFWARYGRSEALISERRQTRPLALLTTTSAFGRSALYNRVSLDGRRLWHHVGHTQGHGEFLFAGDLYSKLRQFVEQSEASPTARHARWGGGGWRNRREVVRRALRLLDLPYATHVHGIRRAIYTAPLGATAAEWLRGAASGIEPIRHSAEQIGSSAVARWMIPRAESDQSYRSWNPDEYRLW